MARVGLANFQIQTGNPSGWDQVWREGLNREHWDHIYHALRGDDPKKKYTYRNAQTEAKEKLAKTWHIVSHVHSSAAGQGSYHYNLNKPSGNVHVYVPSAAFSLVPGRTTFDGKRGVKYNGGVDDLLERQRESYLWAGSNPYQQSTYNEAFYNEGLYNSDSHNKHRRSSSAPGFPPQRAMASRPTLMKPPHHSINARLGQRPGTEQGGGHHQHHNGGGSSGRSGGAPRSGGGSERRAMSQTWSSGGFFPSHSSRGGPPLGGGQDRGFAYDRGGGNGRIARERDYIDAAGDPNVKLGNRAEGGARQTTGPFFRPRHGEGSTVNRTAAGPLNMTWKGRSAQTRSVPAARRVNEPNAASFQRIMAV